MMKKLAIFVEGHTEEIFLSKLLTEIAGNNNIALEIQRIANRSSGYCTFTVIRTKIPNQTASFYILIRNCCNDELVKSAILDSIGSLESKNYHSVIGLRDVYPKNYEDRDKLRIGLNHKLSERSALIKNISIFLSVMEIEAWFIAETSHFEKLGLTLAEINDQLGIDLENIEIEQIKHPFNELRKIYRLAGTAYAKQYRHIERATNLLDYAKLYLNVPNRMPSLKEFIDFIDSFMN